MIVVRLQGGLGNQLFQYAVGRALARRRHTSVKLDASWLDADPKRSYALAAWNIQAKFVTASDLRWFRLHWAVRRRIVRNPSYYRSSVIYEQRPAFDVNILRAPFTCALHGYWQCERYFANIVPFIRREFTLREAPSAASQDVARKIRASNSVFVHIRRGDAVHDPRGARIHGTPPLEYYARATAHIASRIADPHIFVFSDEPEWAKHNFLLPYRMSIIDHNPPGDGRAAGREHEDLWLMSLCRHAVLANSSFSWWAAWLNAERERIIIAPQQWYRDPAFNNPDLIPEHWLRL